MKPQEKTFLSFIKAGKMKTGKMLKSWLFWWNARIAGRSRQILLSIIKTISLWKLAERWSAFSVKFRKGLIADGKFISAAFKTVSVESGKILKNCLFWWNAKIPGSVRTVLFLFVSALLLSGTLQTYLLQKGNLLMVEINDIPLGLISSEDSLNEILSTLEDEASDYYRRPVKAEEEVTFTEVFLPLDKEEPEKISDQLRSMLSYKVGARMVSVNGKDLLPLGSEDDVALLYELLATAYTPIGGNVKLEDVQMDEEISTYEYYCYPEDISDAETLAAILLRGTDRREVYFVSRGDSLWKIARENSLSVDELKDANPQIQGDKLHIGDEINLIVPEPMVKVYTVERLTIEEKIPFTTKYVNDNSLWKMQTEILEAGEYGIKEVIYQISRENGVETSRTILTERIAKEPKEQLVAQGTADIPSRGTGGFIWPIGGGGGRISSGYGWRSGGFHAGVDILAKKGTPILAADSGVVVFSGWDAGYGNCVVIFHGHYYTRYGHNSENKVSNGQAVNKGDVIGNVGMTGHATGYHVHFEVRTGGIYGKTINPLDFFSTK